MYEVALEEMWELFSPYLDGARTGVVCVASAARLGDAARSALENSAAALGYGRACCTYVALRSGRPWAPKKAELARRELPITRLPERQNSTARRCFCCWKD